MNKIIVSKIDIYRSASKRNYNKYKIIIKKINRLLSTPNLFLLGKDLDEMLCEYANQKETHRMAFIVFQAMAVEAFLNEYIYFRCGKLYFESIDKLSLIDKLMVACKMITGKDFQKNCHAFTLLKKMIRHRNNLVHYKVKEIDIQMITKKEIDISEQEMDDILVTYDKLVEMLSVMDDKFDGKYLKQIPDDFWNISY